MHSSLQSNSVLICAGDADEACMEAFVTASGVLEEPDVTESAAGTSAKILSEPAEDGVPEAGALQGGFLHGEGSEEHEGVAGGCCAMRCA